MLESFRALVARLGNAVPVPVRPNARRALPAEDTDEPRAWLTHVLAAIAIAVLGLAVAGSISITGSAVSTDDSNPTVDQSIAPDVRQPIEFARQQDVSRNADREALEQREELAQSAAEKISQQQMEAALAERKQQLAEESKGSAAEAKKLKEEGVTQFPLKTYTLTGRWGDVGPWARYHTGLDMAAPIGTPISAPAAGVVTHAGPGGAAGSWAGCYIVIKHKDGKSTLYAHMNCAQQVQVGDTVAGGTPLGHVGMTGRTFGPHMHFELYPAEATPGDIYSSIDPLPWLMGR